MFVSPASKLCCLIALAVLTTSLLSLPARAESSGDELILVIVNESVPVSSLSRKHVMGLFLGRSRGFPKGGLAKPFDLPVESDLRRAFFERLTGKSISDIDAYWARLKYSGRSSPPKSLADQRSVIEAVAATDNAIAYVSAEVLQSQEGSSIEEAGSAIKGAKIVYRLE